MVLRVNGAPGEALSAVRVGRPGGLAARPGRAHRLPCRAPAAQASKLTRGAGVDRLLDQRDQRDREQHAGEAVDLAAGEDREDHDQRDARGTGRP